VGVKVRPEKFVITMKLKRTEGHYSELSME
jgi:hypothetical protein